MLVSLIDSCGLVSVIVVINLCWSWRQSYTFKQICVHNSCIFSTTFRLSSYIHTASVWFMLFYLKTIYLLYGLISYYHYFFQVFKHLVNYHIYVIRTKLYHDGHFKDHCKDKILGYKVTFRFPQDGTMLLLSMIRSIWQEVKITWPCISMEKSNRSQRGYIAQRIEQSQHAGKAKPLSKGVLEEFTKTRENTPL